VGFIVEEHDCFVGEKSFSRLSKTVKSGFGLEKCRLRHANRLKKFTALASVVAWLVFWITRILRASRLALLSLCYAQTEIKAFNRIEVKAGRESLEKKSFLNTYTLTLARLDGYFARKNNPPPGNIVIWRRLQRLRDVVKLI